MNHHEQLAGERVLLRIFIGESDRHQHQALWEVILARLHAQGFAGATVLRCLSGFGATSRTQPASRFRLSSDAPIILETVDTEEKIRAFLPELESLMDDGLVTLERAHVILYRGGTGNATC